MCLTVHLHLRDPPCLLVAIRLNLQSGRPPDLHSHTRRLHHFDTSMSISAAPTDLASSTTISTTDDYSSYTPYFASSTFSSATATYTGDDTYLVFPNSVYLSRVAFVNAADSGLTTQDQELYNYCYLPFNSVIYTYNKRQASSTSSPTSSPTPRPTYLIDEPPCKRQGSIGTNCYFQNTNHTFPGLTPYSDPQSETALAEQQTCFCSTYPFFDTVLGCQACFEQHGGVEGYHWFPSEYVSAVSKTYCAAPSLTTDFYGFVKEWASTQTDVSVGSTTASNVLGSETSMEAYYTYNTAAPSSSISAGQVVTSRSTRLARTLCAVIASYMICAV